MNVTASNNSHISASYRSYDDIDGESHHEGAFNPEEAEVADGQFDVGENDILEENGEMYNEDGERQYMENSQNYEENEEDDEDNQDMYESDHDNEYTEGEYSQRIDGQNYYIEPEEDVDEENSNLAPERKIRYKLFRFINKLRQKYSLPEFQQDPLGNVFANQYAKFLLKEKENDKVLHDMAKQFNFKGEFNISTFTVFVDVSSDSGNKRGRYNDYLNEFVDAHAVLVEFANDRDNMLSREYNTVAIGLAFDDEKVVVVDLFMKREVYLDSCSINEEMGSIIVKGHMLNDSSGVYAMRIASMENPNKHLLLINPSNIISPDQKNRPFTGSFSNAKSILSDNSLKMVDILVRDQPNKINYGKPFTDSQNKFEKDLEFLRLGFRFFLDQIPNEQILREQKKEEEDEIRKIEEEDIRKAEEKKKEKDEREHRMKSSDGEGGKYFNNVIAEDPHGEDDDDDSIREGNKIIGKKQESFDAKFNKSMYSRSATSIVDSIKSDAIGNKENYEKQLDRLEQNIDELKRENEDLQKKIRIIYDFRKKEGRDERNYYKESNINESTYADSLTSAANLHNELNTHKRKLMADLEKYNQSIEIQEERKREVYKILMNYKEELLQNAEYRKGTKIPREQIEKWLEKERESEDEIRRLRIENIKNTLELNRLNKELKKMEEYFEGLHLIDFEQLKIENNTLTEKIEDRNEEIHKLKNKINDNVQILAHLQEKYSYVNKEYKTKKAEEDKLKEKLVEKKDMLGEVKQNNENNTLKKLQSRQKIDQVNSSNLKEYYSKTNNNIKDLENKITVTINQLIKLRRNKDAKDIKLLESRSRVLIQEYEKLPKIEKENDQR